MATLKQQKWLVKLLGYDYEILHRPRRENPIANSLSQKQGSPILNHLFIPQVNIWDDIKQTAKKDQYIQMMGSMAIDQAAGPYAWQQSLVYYKGNVIVLDNETLRTRLLHEMHDNKVGKHSGVLRTFKKLGQQFY